MTSTSHFLTLTGSGSFADSMQPTGRNRISRIVWSIFLVLLLRLDESGRLAGLVGAAVAVNGTASLNPKKNETCLEVLP